MNIVPKSDAHEVALLVLTHFSLSKRGYQLRRICLDAVPRTPERIQVRLIWRRPLDRTALVRRVVLAPAQMASLMSATSLWAI